MTRRQIVITAVVAAVAIIAGWWFFFYQPRGEQITQRRERLEAEQRTEQTLRATLRQRQDLAAREPEFDRKLAQLAVYLPERPELPQFIYDATRIAQEAGVDFISISPALPDGGSAGEGVIRLSIQIQGGFFQLLDYLVRVEQMPRTVVVDSIQVSPSVSPDGLVVLDVGVSGRMFTDAVPRHVSLPPQPGAPAPVAPVPPPSAPSVTGTAVPTTSG